MFHPTSFQYPSLSATGFVVQVFWIPVIQVKYIFQTILFVASNNWCDYFSKTSRYFWVQDLSTGRQRKQKALRLIFPLPASREASLPGYDTHMSLFIYNFFNRSAWSFVDKSLIAVLAQLNRLHVLTRSDFWFSASVDREGNGLFVWA